MAIYGICMAKLEFDPSKLGTVPIERVVPNGYNPKDDGTSEFQKLKRGIKLKGLRAPIIVREHPHAAGTYEIIDGQQRYTAAKELGYKQLWIYNEGALDDHEAKEMTIWYQKQIPFKKISEAYLVTDLIDNYQLDGLELPYSDFELSSFQDLAMLNIGDFVEDKHPGDKYQSPEKENRDGSITFTVKMEKSDYEIVEKALGAYARAHGVETIQEAFILTMADLLVTQGGD